MTDDQESRGQSLARRRNLLRRSQLEIAQMASIDRKTVIRAEQDLASDQAMDVVDRLLTTLEAQEGPPPVPPQPSAPAAEVYDDRVRFKIRGPHTSWELDIEGPVEDIDKVTAAVEKLLRDMDSDE